MALLDINMRSQASISSLSSSSSSLAINFGLLGRAHSLGTLTRAQSPVSTLFALHQLLFPSFAQNLVH